MTAYESLEMAGMWHGSHASADDPLVGTFYGQSSDDWREVNAGQDIGIFHTSGGIRAFGPGRLNYHFGWEGPSMSIDAACSSSAVAIQLACSSLKAKECNAALAGGANIMTAPDMFAGLSRGRFLSVTGSCKTWDENADGYCRADAVGTLVLKRLEDAIRDKDNILGVIKSVATNHSCRAVSITHPHAETQRRLFESTLLKAGINASQVDFIEMHGTGTIAGDNAESQSVAACFGKSHTESKPLFIGTVKPNLGHGEAASGVTSIMKAIMMLRKGLIPKHIGIKTGINESLAIHSSESIRISMDTIPFTTVNEDGKRRILMNNFNATGGNTCILLEEFPESRPHNGDPRQKHIIAMSGATEQSLTENIRRMAQHLTSNPSTDLADLSYTTTARRTHHRYRLVWVATKTHDLVGLMEGSLKSASPKLPTPRSLNPVFVFTGQSSQYSGMGQRLYQTSKPFKEHIDSFEEICKQLALPSFVQVITGNPSKDQNSNTTIICSQLALVALEIALALLWLSWGLAPKAIVGHSLGEFAALCIAGVLTIRDTFFLVGTRAHLVATRCKSESHAMLAIRMPTEQLKESLGKSGLLDCEVACINGPELTVVSGPTNQVNELHRQFGSRSKSLQSHFAFHSAQMNSILEDLGEAALGVKYSRPIFPIASTLLGRLVTNEGIFNAEYIQRQTREPVDFLNAINKCVESFNATDSIMWIEVGPDLQCLRMISAITGVNDSQLVMSMDKREDNWTTITNGLARVYTAGADIAWSEYHNPFRNSLKMLDLPTYAFDLKSYWLQYKGDWSITKNRSITESSDTVPPARLHSTTLHCVREARQSEGRLSMEFTSDLADKALNSIIGGHTVGGVGLCPSSVYADMAMTAASQLWELRPVTSGPDLTIEVSNLEILRPLIIQMHTTSQVIHLSATSDSKSDEVSLSIESRGGQGKEVHARCVVSRTPTEVLKEGWECTAYLFQSRIESLMTAASLGTAHKILQGMVYKLFSSQVSYTLAFQCMKEVFLDSKAMEAAALIELQPTETDEQFLCSPHWIDGLAHLSGFVLNGSDTSPEDTVFISDGWKCMRIILPLESGKRYHTYVRMRNVKASRAMKGDVWIFDGCETVGVFEGLNFRAIKKSMLPTLLAKEELPQKVTNFQTVKKLRKPDPLDSSTLSSYTINIVADELGISTEKLLDEMRLDEVGIDSLLAISISSRLQQSLRLHCPSSSITKCETIGQLKKTVEACSTVSSNDKPIQSTPLTGKDISDQSPPPNIVTSVESGSFGKDSDISRMFYRVLADELDVDLRELHAGLIFSDLGVDSLLSLSITSEFAARSNFHLPTMFFHEHPTLGNACTFLEQAQNRTQISREGLSPGEQPKCSGCPHVYLQGPTAPSSSNLFLFPDGSGSVGSYANFPRLSAAVSVIAFGSPFHDRPRDFVISIQELAQIFVCKMLTLQPEGPYLLGGWSIGGVYAYEATAQLLRLGKQVKGLILLDAPCPTALPPFPIDNIDVLESLGVFDQTERREADVRVSTNILQHFASSIGALENYAIEPLPHRKPTQPICRIIWARHGVLEGLSTRKREQFLTTRRHEVTNFNKFQKWLMVSRVDYTPNGWDKLINTNIKCSIIDGDHFSMMRHPKVQHSQQAPITIAFAKNSGQQAALLVKAIDSALADICKS